MKLLRLKPALIAALLLSQGSAFSLIGWPQAHQAANAFNFGKKKADGPDAAGAAKDDTKEGAKAGAAKDETKDEEPKEKVKGKSKADIEEEEALQAEYDAYQKELTTLLKTVKTPFGSNNQKADKDADSELSPMSIAGSTGAQSAHLSLGARLLPAKVYMPARMVIGHTAEFTIRSRPGYWAALAMADKDKGAKPIYGHGLRLGPDRKVVALGKIGAGGVLTLKIFAPVAGDLVGGNLYFEAAVWPENAPERLELAQPVSSESQAASKANSVAIIGEGDRKRGLKFVPDNTSPYSHINGPGIGSGSPL